MNEDEYEKIFTIDKSSKKYFYKLTQAIKFLLSKQRIIEAKHHFKELEILKPNSRDTMILGFNIATKTFDNKMAAKYDKLMVDSRKVNNKELNFKRIIYWLSTNEIDNAEICINYLLDECALTKDELLELYEIIKCEIDIECLNEKINKYAKRMGIKFIRKNN